MVFFLFTFGWTWSFWIAAAIFGLSVRTPLGQSLLLLGLMGPMLGGIIGAWLTRSGGSWQDYWARVVDPRRIRDRWWAVTLLFVPALMATAVLLAISLGDDAVPALLQSNANRILGEPTAVAGFLLGLLLLGPLPEELGWRGFALEVLQRRFRALRAALILGTLWAVWHTPLFFMNGMLHSRHDIGSTWFWLFMAQTLSMSVVMTWLFNSTRRSTLAAILFHYTANLAFALGNVSDLTNTWAALLWISAAVLLSTARALRS